MHRDVIQIIKHNGDSDAFLKPGFLPDMTPASLNAANQSSQHCYPPYPPTSPFPHEPNIPISSFWWKKHVLSCWGESSHFPERFATKKIKKKLFFLFFFLNFQKDLGLSQHPPCQRFITFHDAGGAPCMKGFQGKRVRDFYTFPSPALSQSRVIIHSCRLVGDDAPLTFPPPTALLLHIRGRKDCQSLTSAVFSLSRSSVRHISPANKISEESHGAFCLPYLQTFRCKQHVTQEGQDGNTHTVILLFFVLFYWRKAQQSCWRHHIQRTIFCQCSSDYNRSSKNK